MTYVRHALVTVLLIATLFPAVASAQDTTERDPWLSAFSVGFPSFEGDMSLMLFTVGGNFTKMGPGKLSPDFSIGTMPYALSFGVIPWAVRGGVALPMQPSENVFIIPSAGLSAVAAVGAGGGGAIGGTNLGFAIATRSGARVGITWHRFSDAGTIMLLEFGVGRIR
jgi:hypothetical protein